MSHMNILEELRKFPPAERLTIMEAALKQIRADLQQPGPLLRVNKKRALAIAADALYADYMTDKDLTVFTALDAEDFHAER
jgi:hypothetical protein